jgi:hypothetical protein
MEEKQAREKHVHGSDLIMFNQRLQKESRGEISPQGCLWTALTDTQFYLI